MKISFNWLKQYIELTESPAEVSEVLTATGLEVEGLEKVETIKGGLQGLVIGKVLTCEQHPNADKLKVTTVDVGAEEPAPIVCGAPNVAAGQTVVVALPGTTLYPSGGEPFKIKKAKIRGEVSQGMICAEDEIGLGSSHEGIIVLEEEVAPGTPAAEYFKPETDYVIEIGLTPNRADATSHIGVARDLKAIYHRPVQWPDVDDFAPDNHDLPIAVEVKNHRACPRYSGLTISGITVRESPAWLQKRLLAIGLNPINNVVDVTNFVLHEMGQPLHAFDAAKITGRKVVVQTLEPGTPFVTLDEQERKLTDNDLMICNAEEGMCIAGVLGGLHSGVSAETTAIFLESAYFAPEYIRQTAQQHQIKTDASFRFERGTDPNITVYALKRAALLIKEVAGGSISSDIVDVYPEPIEDFRVPVKKQHITRLIGKELPDKEIKQILTDLDIKITDETEQGFTAIVPPYRVDVQREADVIEEILRIHGFDNVELPAHLGATYLAEHPPLDRNRQQQKIAAYLAANGCYEIMTNSLTRPAYSEMTPAIDAGQNVEILNKLSEDLGVLRQSLLFTGLEVVTYNINRRQKDLKLFEFGKVYRKSGQEYEETPRLGLWLTGRAMPENWAVPAKPVDFTHLSGLVKGVLAKMNIGHTTSVPTTNPLFQYGLTISHHDQVLVELGLVNKAITKKMALKQEVFYADFAWDLLLSRTSDIIVIDPPSRYPEVRRDLSLVIDKSVQFRDVMAVIEKTERQLIKKVDVFDVYEGENLGDDSKKAYALKFILEDKNKTLTDKIIDKTMNRLMQAFETELGALIRK